MSVRLHPSITTTRIMRAVKARRHSLEDPGICIACGADTYGVEPDARRYECEACGARAVYGVEELLIMVAP